MLNGLFLDVVIAGRNVSSVLAPLVVSVEVTDSSENEADTANIVLADNGGRTYMPRARDPVSISLGRGAIGMGLVFEGFVDEPISKCTAQSGRTLTLSCTSVDLGGKAKQALEKHWDDQTLGDILKDAFADTGISMLVDPAFASVERVFESMDGRDPLSFAADMADEMGATFKMMGSRAVFAQRNTGLALTGAAIPTFVAAWGDNLLEWSVRPYIPKASYARVVNRWFDFDLGDWKDAFEQSIGEADFLDTRPIAGEAIAKSRARSNKTSAEREGGAGTISVRGDFRAMAGGRCRVGGARPGVDGTYVISTVTHTANVADGWISTIELANPLDGAGVDSRGAE